VKIKIVTAWYNSVYYTVLILSMQYLGIEQREGDVQDQDPEVVTAAVGRNVRAERSRRNWTLDDLAGRSGVSKGMLIQVEQARSNPSIATICRLASALGVTVASLVEAPELPSARVVRADEGVVLWTGRDGSASRLLVGTGTRDPVELWDVRLAPGDGYGGTPHPAGTQELLIVLEGEMTLEVDGIDFRVGPGDTAAFVADRPHGYHNRGGTQLRFTMVVAQRGLSDGADAVADGSR
jgi:transcriptional regulator with XRE-family HTH domain